MDTDGSDFDDTTYDDPSFDDATGLDDTMTMSTDVTLDLDGDGFADAVAHDLDGDGVVDAVEYDLDGDGFTDAVELDTDGDGVSDTVLFEDGTGATYVGVDTDGDGVLDTVVADYDGDGIIDEQVSTDHDPTSTTIDPTADDPDDPNDPAATIDGEPDNGPFITDDQPEAGEEGVHGEPRADIQYHQVQPGPVDCLPTSVAMAISEATGIDVPADDVVALANEQGFMTDAGMSPDDAAALFEAYGMDAEVGSGTVDDLRSALDAGDPVIVGIDAADLYSGDGGPFDQGMVSGHAVVITGIDDGPPGVVYINDPGFPDGAGLEIPLEQFEDAWEDSDHTVVTATSGDVGASEVSVVDDGTDQGLDAIEAARRILFLPITFEVV
ncbi:MAG: C39 family peptidase [Actinobacteria bacterium]|nr:C39 family peptidase [Actinomycetota bacterium]